MLEDLGRQMTPRIEGNDLGRVGPGGLRWDFDGGFGFGVVGLVGGDEGAHGDGEGAVDGVRTGVGADGVTGFEGGGEAGGDDGTAVVGVGAAPLERMGVHAVLIRVGCIR